jgi:CRP-like cAMP-binding protein
MVIVNILQASMLFEMISGSELNAAAEAIRVRKFAAGETVFEEGDLGDSIFVIASGQVEVQRKDAVGERRVIETMGPNEFFGEMALIDKEYRSATICAVVDSVLLQWTADQIASFRKVHRDSFTFIVLNIARGLSRRLREADARLCAK